ncbi:hypothetical protein BDF19DRAFT_432354, partial [Syncephalis fuscata]
MTMSLAHSLNGQTRRWVSSGCTRCFQPLSSLSSVAMQPARSHQQQRTYYVSNSLQAAYPPPAPSHLGDSLQASAAESKTVAQDRFYALHRPLLSYQPSSRPRSIFMTEDDEAITIEWTTTGRKQSKAEDNAMEALAEKFHYFLPFHPPKLVRPSTAPAVARVLSPAADPHYWAQHGLEGDAEGSGIVNSQLLANGFLKEGSKITQQQQQPLPTQNQKPAPLYATSIKRKRKLKMNKHKRRKLRKRTRALRKRL